MLRGLYALLPKESNAYSRLVVGSYSESYLSESELDQEPSLRFKDRSGHQHSLTSLQYSGARVPHRGVEDGIL